MSSVDDWELLRLTRVSTTVTGSGERAITREEHSRLRVAVRGRWGEHRYRCHAAPTAAQVRAATAEALTGPPIGAAFGAAYPSTPATGAPTGGPPPCDRRWTLRTGRELTSVRFVTAAGATLSWEHADTRALIGERLAGREVAFAVVPHGTAAVRHASDVLPAADVVPARDGVRSSSWLIGPLALGTLLAAACREAVLGRRRVDPWPAATRLVNGDRPPTDLEGTPVRPTILIDGSGATATVRTLADSARCDGLTGHAGLSGPDLAALRIECHRVADGPAEALFVVDARTVAGAPDVFACTVLSAPPWRGAPVSTVIVRRTDPFGVLGDGHWVRPVHGGRGDWTCPWWEAMEPARAFAVLHVE
jgi:hypothetical protein